MFHHYSFGFSTTHGRPPAHTKIAVHHRRSLCNTSTIKYSSALTSKPNPPITPRAKRLASVFDKQGIRGENQKNGEDGYGNGYERQDLVRGNSCAHVASDVQQRCDPKEAQRKDHEALHKVRESGSDSYHGCPSLSPAPFSYLYSPGCVEGKFLELRNGVLGSSAIAKACKGRSPSERCRRPESGQPRLAAPVTSLTVMRPSEPVPSTCQKSTPSSWAFCLADPVASGSCSLKPPPADRRRLAGPARAPGLRPLSARGPQPTDLANSR